MTAVRIYPAGSKDPWTLTERCRAEVVGRTADPTRRRCGNRAPSLGPNEGLCWRHR